MFSNGFERDRKDLLPSSSDPASKSAALNNPTADGKRRGRNWAMIALAASVAVPPGIWQLPRLLASDAPTGKPATQPSTPAAPELPKVPLLAADAIERAELLLADIRFALDHGAVQPLVFARHDLNHFHRLAPWVVPVPHRSLRPRLSLT